MGNINIEQQHLGVKIEACLNGAAVAALAWKMAALKNGSDIKRAAAPVARCMRQHQHGRQRSAVAKQTRGGMSMARRQRKARRRKQRQ